MADNFESALTNALNKQPRIVSYPHYRPSEDFSLWLSGYLARVRTVCGFSLLEDDKVKQEVIRSLPALLSTDGALDAYNCLTKEEKEDYGTLIQKLTDEFTNPLQRRKFLEKKDFNRRKKGQSLKEFAQEIHRAMESYSPLPNEIPDATGKMVNNPDFEHEGVRRFRNGMRGSDGKLDVELAKLLNFHLMEETELKWDKALKVAERWEMAESLSKGSGKSSGPPEDKELGALGAKKGNKSKSNSNLQSTESPNTISALVDQVHDNSSRIEQLEFTLERLATAMEELTTAQKESNSTLHAIAAALGVFPESGGDHLDQFPGQQLSQHSYQPRFLQPSPSHRFLSVEDCQQYGSTQYKEDAGQQFA